jgi:alpha-amylase
LDNLVRVAGSLTTNSGPDNGIQLIWDAVLNHKTAGDACDETWAVEVDPGDRRVEICAPKKIEAWLKYDFPGRAREGMKYSALRWTAEHFSGTDWDQKRGRNAIYKLIDEPGLDGGACEGNEEKTEQTRGGSETFIQFARSIKKHARNIQQGSGTVSRRAGKGWAEDVDNTHGNYDYLIFSNIYYSHPDVRKDVLAWGRWMIESTGIHGFRLDAAQHFSWNFIREWITTVQAASRTKWGRDAFIVGEVWSDQVGRIVRWLDAVTPLQARGGHGGGAWAFDAPLLYSFSRISEDVRRGSKNADLRTLLSGPPTHPDHSALVSLRPNQAVTFVTNHDTQPGQSSFTPVDASLKALFYAFVLLRHQGLPCVFWGDLYGTLGDLAEPPSCCLPLPVTAPSAPCPPAGPPPRSHSRPLLPALMRARHHFAYGPQHDYFDAASCIGWTRDGTHDRPGCVVIMSIGSPEQWTIKKMRAPGCAGERWVDMLGVAGDGRPECVLEEGGWGVFACRGRTVSVYVEEGRLGNMAGGDAVEDVYRC